LLFWVLRRLDHWGFLTLKEAVYDLKVVLAGTALQGCHWTIGITPTWDQEPVRGVKSASAAHVRRTVVLSMVKIPLSMDKV
jgi:hypothetical protein